MLMGEGRRKQGEPRSAERPMCVACALAERRNSRDRAPCFADCVKLSIHFIRSSHIFTPIRSSQLKVLKSIQVRICTSSASRVIPREAAV